MLELTKLAKSVEPSTEPQEEHSVVPQTESKAEPPQEALLNLQNEPTMSPVNNSPNDTQNGITN